jgi:WD40 repeat protein
LASNDGRGLSKVAEILAHLPIAEIPAAGDQNRSILGHKLNADNTLLSAKSAFLPADSKTATMLTSNGGLYKLFENFLARHEETWWLRFFSSSLAFTLGPSHKMSLEDLIASYSTTRDLNQAPVRCLAWHPHCAKLALALKDDTVQVVTSTSSIKPILKHKKQRQVTCLAWRPFSGSELAVGCASGLLIWNVDPVSVVARPSTACVSILSDGLKHPVTSLAW